MPPGGVHLAVGTTLARLLPDKAMLGGDARALSWLGKSAQAGDPVSRRCALAARLGFVVGSILPDADLLGCVAAVAVTGDRGWIDILHRKATHSLPLIVVIAVYAHKAACWSRARAEGTGAARHAAEGPQPQCQLGTRQDEPEAVARGWLAPYVRTRAEAARLCFGAACGAFVHVLLDLFYLQPFSPLWPYPATYGPLIGPTAAEIDAFGGDAWKWITWLDFLSDALLFTLPMLIICRVYSLHKEVYRSLLVFALAQLAVLALFAPLLDDVRVGHEDFVFYLHIPGVVWMVFCDASPLLLRHAVVRAVSSDSGPEDSDTSTYENECAQDCSRSPSPHELGGEGASSGYKKLE